ncbi:MAG: hypothetical protein K0S80_5027 [Neobacillus sp.]|jgi:hypothetical protein|nr:hypothetical protein [Neobacillus sp.]
MENKKVVSLQGFKFSSASSNNGNKNNFYELEPKKVYNEASYETAVTKSSGGDDGMDGNDYVKHRELKDELTNLRTEIGLQFENQYLKIDKLINDKSAEDRKERKSDKHWIIGTSIATTSVIVAIASIILGIVLH